jgi:hypothetical protein
MGLELATGQHTAHCGRTDAKNARHFKHVQELSRSDYLACLSG